MIAKKLIILSVLPILLFPSNYQKTTKINKQMIFRILKYYKILKTI